jgi:hypothetical protein
MAQRAGVLFLAWWVFCSLLIPGQAVAQDQYDCASFGSQAAAQAELERDPSDPSNLDADDDGEACEVYDYGTSGGGGLGSDLDCADFSSQAEAQVEYESDTTDPNGLDADDDGEACEDFDYGTPPAGQQYDNDPPEEEDVIIKTIPDKPLPKTGGWSIVIVAVTILVSTILLGSSIVRNR